MKRLGFLLVFVAACKGPAQEARTEPPPVPSPATVVTAPAPVGEEVAVDYRTQSPFGHEVTRVVTKRFAPLLPMDRHLPFDDNLRLGWNFQWNRFARYEVHWPAADATSNG